VTPEMTNPKSVPGGSSYKFQKVFSEGEFIASGVLILPKGAKKPNKNSHQSAMVNLPNIDICSPERSG
jgi:Mif2/CENP-C like